MQRRSRESVRDAWGGDVSELSYHELSYHEQGYSTRAQHGMKRVQEMGTGDVPELPYNEQGYSTRAQHGMKRVQGMYPHYHAMNRDTRHVRNMA